MRTLLTTPGQLHTASPDMFPPPGFSKETFSSARHRPESKPGRNCRELRDEHTTIASQRSAGWLRYRDGRDALRLTAEAGSAFIETVTTA